MRCELPLSMSNPKPGSHRKYDYRHYYLDPQFSPATHGKPRSQSRANHTTHADDDARTPVNLPHPGKDNESRQGVQCDNQGFISSYLCEISGEKMAQCEDKEKTDTELHKAAIKP